MCKIKLPLADIQDQATWICIKTLIARLEKQQKAIEAIDKGLQTTLINHNKGGNNNGNQTPINPM